MSSSIGMMTFPTYGKIEHVPNHQPVLVGDPIVMAMAVDGIAGCKYGDYGLIHSMHVVLFVLWSLGGGDV